MGDIATYPVHMAEMDQTYVVGLQLHEFYDVKLDSAIQVRD